MGKRIVEFPFAPEWSGDKSLPGKIQKHGNKEIIQA
jgi:hypothetical protein